MRSFACASAHASPSVAPAMDSKRAFGIRFHSNSADHTGVRLLRACAAKSMSRRATVASNAGRAPVSNASCPFRQRATHDANNRRLSSFGSARSSANASASGFSSQSSGSIVRAIVRFFSPTWAAPNAASSRRPGGRSGVSRATTSSDPSR